MNGILFCYNERMTKKGGHCLTVCVYVYVYIPQNEDSSVLEALRGKPNIRGMPSTQRYGISNMKSFRFPGPLIINGPSL